MRFFRYGVLVLLVVIAGTLMVLGQGDDENNDDEVVPTFYEHVKPIIVENCLGCHTEGQIAGDISLADDALIESSADVAFLTSTRYMPPWMPSQDSLPMQHDRSLSDEEIAVIQAWAEAGAPVGEEADYIEPQIAFELPELEVSQTIQLDEAYTPEEGVDDDYRCFAFTPEIDEPVFLTGYEFLPDVAEQVHHGILYLVEDSATPEIERFNYADGRVGWSCYTGTNVRNSDEEFLGTWTPGTFPTVFPEGTGYLIQPGDIFILQIHYNLLVTREPDRTAVNLQYADGESDLRRLLTFELQAPVEIPCPTGITGEQCDRDVAIARATGLYRESFIDERPDDLLEACGQTIADYADNVGENATTFCDYPVPLPLTVLGVFGHMHELGVHFEMELNPESDNPVTILDIPAWDFHWQDRYQLEEPLFLGLGDTVRMSCTWDNTLAEEPRYVVWGEGTQDEMCFATVMIVLPQ